MNTLKQIFTLLLFCCLGELVSFLIGGFVPGSIIGMLLLFIALNRGIVAEESVEGAATFLTTNMGIFFVPAGVGLITQVDVFRSSWHIILTCVVVSSILVIGTVGLMQDRWERTKTKKHNQRQANTPAGSN